MQFAKDGIAKKIDEIAKENTENGGQKGSTDWERGAEDYNRVVDQFFAAAFEFATDVEENMWKATFLREHAKVVIPNHALQVLMNL